MSKGKNCQFKSIQDAKASESMKQLISVTEDSQVTTGRRSAGLSAISCLDGNSESKEQSNNLRAAAHEIRAQGFVPPSSLNAHSLHSQVLLNNQMITKRNLALLLPVEERNTFK